MLDMLRTVERGDTPRELQKAAPRPLPLTQLRVHAYRDAASALKNPETCALRVARPLRRPVRDRRAEGARGVVVRADLDRERALRDGVQKRRWPKVARDARAPAEADHAGTREDDRVEGRVWRVELGYAGVSARGESPL